MKTYKSKSSESTQPVAQRKDTSLAPRANNVSHKTVQAQSRAKPVMQMKSGISINDDQTLKREADTIGTKATQLRSSGYNLEPPALSNSSQASNSDPVQRVWKEKGGDRFRFAY